MDEFFGTFFGNTPVSQQLAYLQAALLENIWETVYSTVLSTLFAYVIGLPLGIILVTGEPDGIRPLPRGLMRVLNFIINILRSIPFLILMILVIPLSRLILHTSIGTNAAIIPLVVASAPFVARLVEGSLRESDAGVIEAAKAMGCTPFQIVRKVMLPEALPSLITGLTRRNWFLNRGAKLYYFYYQKENQKTVIILEPSAELVDMIRKYLPRGAYQE